MSTITIEREYIAENEEEFATFATKEYDLDVAKNEIDFLVEVVGRDSYVDKFVYGMSRGLLYASFESDHGYAKMLNRLTSIAETTEDEVEDDVSSYTVTINNL
jgi:hypothetical protein